MWAVARVARAESQVVAVLGTAAAGVCCTMPVHGHLRGQDLHHDRISGQRHAWWWRLRDLEAFSMTYMSLTMKAKQQNMGIASSGPRWILAVSKLRNMQQDMLYR